MSLTTDDYEHVMADHRRLARLLDVAMHGEEQAAPQASLCDLIKPAADMADENKQLREYAFEVSKALTGLTVGGSEFFADENLGFFKADIPACVKNIEWRMEQRAKLAVARALTQKEDLK